MLVGYKLEVLGDNILSCTIRVIRIYGTKSYNPMLYQSVVADLDIKNQMI